MISFTVPSLGRHSLSLAVFYDRCLEDFLGVRLHGLRVNNREHLFLLLLTILYYHCGSTLRCHPINSGRHVCGRTSRGHTGGKPHRISPPSCCGACINFYREKDSAVPFPRRQ